MTNETINHIEEAALNSTHPLASDQLETARMFAFAADRHAARGNEARAAKSRANAEYAYKVLAHILRIEVSA